MSSVSPRRRRSSFKRSPTIGWLTLQSIGVLCMGLSLIGTVLRRANAGIFEVGG
jgi:hypothetical protein